MIISELIKQLEDHKREHGDIKCVVSEKHEYWGSVESELSQYNMGVRNAQPDGPKSGKSEVCVVFEY